MTSFTRRRFLEVLSVSASAVALSGCYHDEDGHDYAILAPEWFPQSVASGDPRSASVVVWTRVQFSEGDTLDRELRLQVATDRLFNSVIVDQSFTAKAANDHCLKVRVNSLNADTFYYYRFIVSVNGKHYASRSGRTRTAPAVASDRTVKFAYVSCQDFIGRYYNPYMALLAMDVDFIVHLGDYIYETSGDPQFQSPTSTRKVVFSDTEGAIALGDEDHRFYAAQSLSNYRELYQHYRSDSALQAMHESFPFICIWDDHEFSDDSFGATATYLNGAQSESNETRKRNAEQAYFDYMPIDISNGGTQTALEQTSADFYPNARIYRDFQFGSNVHLMMADFRSYRPDHLIPEQAFPGHIALDKTACIMVLGSAGAYDAVKANFKPYLDFGSEPWSAYAPVIQGVLTAYYVSKGAAPATAAELATSLASAKINAEIAKSLVDQYNATPGVTPVAPIDPAIFPSLERGIDFSLMGKSSVFSELGSRYFVVKPTYDMYAGYRHAISGGDAQNAYGAEQMQWLQLALSGSTARWKILGSSVSMTSLVLDLSSPSLGIPAPFNQKFYLNVDHWDGFPQQRDAIKALLPAGSLVISGDIHASFVTDHGDGIYEFTGTSVSSATSAEMLRSTAASDPTLSSIPNVGMLIASLDSFLKAGNAQIKYSRSNSHGFSVVTATATHADVTYYEWDENSAMTNSYAVAPAIIANAKTKSFRVDDNNELQLL